MATLKETDLVIAKFDYKATDVQELNIHKGEKLTLIDDTQHWWKVMNSFGQTGYVPSNYVKRSKQSLFSSLRNTLGRRKSRSDLPSVVVNSSTRGGTPSLPDSTCNGTTTAEGGRAPKVSSESFSYVPPCSLNQSPGKVITTVAYQPVVSSFGQHTNSGVGGRPPLMPQNYQMPPAASCLADQPHHAAQAESTSLGNLNPSRWNVGPATSGTAPMKPGPLVARGPLPIDATGGGGSISSRQLYVARFAYTACQLDELSIQRGDRICVFEKSSDGWWHGVLLPPEDSSAPQQYQQPSGWFPSNYVTADSNASKSTIPDANVNPSNSLNNNSQPHPSNGPPVVAPTSGTMSTGLPNALAPVTTAPVTLTQTQFPIAQGFSTPISADSYAAVPFPASSVFQSTQQQPQQSLAVVASANIFDGGSPSDRLQCRESVLTLYPFTRNQAEELSFGADEVLEVLDKPVDDPDWWRCRNAAGNVGLVPRNYIRVIRNSHLQPHLQQPAPTQTQFVSPRTAVEMDSARQGGGGGCGEEVRLAFAAASQKSAAFSHKVWYWGAISRSECESLLSNMANPGEFIVRDSESHPGDLAITMNAGLRNRNFKIHVENGEFHIGQKVFPSVDALIDNYRHHQIYKNDQEKHFLTQPFQHPDSAAILSSNRAPRTSSLQTATPMLMQLR